MDPDPMDRMEDALHEINQVLVAVRDKLGDATQGVWLLRELLRRTKQKVESLEVENKRLKDQLSLSNIV